MFLAVDTPVLGGWAPRHGPADARRYRPRLLAGLAFALGAWPARSFRKARANGSTTSRLPRRCAIRAPRTSPAKTHIKCLEDAALRNSSPTCDALAVEKKLAGSARTRFMRNCIAQRSGGPPG